MLTVDFTRFKAYRSCVVLLFDGFQRLLHGFPESDWSKNLHGVGNCLEVLLKYSELDPISLRFYNALRIYSDVLYAGRVKEIRTAHAALERSELAQPGPPQTSTYLLTLPRGNSLFHCAARHLLTLATSPYGSKETTDILGLPILSS